VKKAMISESARYRPPTALRLLVARYSGAVHIAELARETGWTSRHLGTRFRDEFGLTPKAAAWVVRFVGGRRPECAREPVGLNPPGSPLA
jgi:AraC-like DNA-binding protein